MSDPKPIGSGAFSLTAGAVFLVLFVGSYKLNLRGISPYSILQAWLLFAAAILLVWGTVRVVKVRKATPLRWEVGQSTLNFVVGVIAATAAIFALVLERSG